MAKSTKKKTTKKSKPTRTKKSQARAEEYLDCLAELHKLQGVLLAQLKKEF